MLILILRIIGRGGNAIDCRVVSVRIDVTRQIAMVVVAKRFGRVNRLAGVIGIDADPMCDFQRFAKQVVGVERGVLAWPRIRGQQVRIVGASRIDLLR